MKKIILYILGFVIVLGIVLASLYFAMPKSNGKRTLQNNEVITASENNKTVVIEKGNAFFVSFTSASISMKSNGVLSMINYPQPPKNTLEFQALTTGDTFITFGNTTINVHVIPSPNKFHCMIAVYCPAGHICYQPCLH